MIKTLTTALVNRYTYNFRGLITTQDLFSLKVNDLKSIGRELSKRKNELGGDDEFSVDTKSNKELEEICNKIDIIKYIIKYKEDEATEKEIKLSAKRDLAKLIALKDAKKEEALKNMSEADLDKLIAEAQSKLV